VRQPGFGQLLSEFQRREPNLLLATPSQFDGGQLSIPDILRVRRSIADLARSDGGQGGGDRGHPAEK